MLHRWQFAALAAWIVVSLSATQGLAQAPTPEQLTLRPGDKIIWIDQSNGHLVLFGTGSLIPLESIQKVFTFEPALQVEGKFGFSQQGGNPMLIATVQANSGVTAIDFTCGAHDITMRSKVFTIAPTGGQPARELKIKAIGQAWMLETSSGDVNLNLSQLASAHVLPHGRH